MKLTFYRSALCPRCAVVAKTLGALADRYPDLSVETVEVVTNPLKTWKDGIRMIPTLRAGEETLSGLFLSPRQVRSFFERNRDRD